MPRTALSPVEEQFAMGCLRLRPWFCYGLVRRLKPAAVTVVKTGSVSSQAATDGRSPAYDGR